MVIRPPIQRYAHLRRPLPTASPSAYASCRLKTGGKSGYKDEPRALAALWHTVLGDEWGRNHFNIAELLKPLQRQMQSRSLLFPVSIQHSAYVLKKQGRCGGGRASHSRV